MGCLIVSGIKFYVLAEGESYPDPHADNRYVGAYAVFTFEGKWVAIDLSVERNYIFINHHEFNPLRRIFFFYA